MKRNLFPFFFFAEVEATVQTSLSMMRCLFLTTLKPELVSFSCCQSASKVYQSVFSAEIFPPMPFLCVFNCSSTCSLQLYHKFSVISGPHSQKNADKCFGFPEGPSRKAKNAAFCFHFPLSGSGAAGLAVLALFHLGQI